VSDHLRKSIQELTQKLQKQEAEVQETKQAINSLYKMLGEPPKYDLGQSTSSQTTLLRPDTFFGKGLATAVGEYLEMRGHAVPVAEIMTGLNEGGYDFGNAKFPERVLRINLAKNSAKFVPIKGSDSFGLRKWYPGLQKADKGERPEHEIENVKQDNQTQLTPTHSPVPQPIESDKEG